MSDKIESVCSECGAKIGWRNVVPESWECPACGLENETTQETRDAGKAREDRRFGQPHYGHDS